jgi:hypothetical protein
MQFKIKALCQRVRRNNGIIETFLSRRARMGNELSQQEDVLLNTLRDRGVPEHGAEYWVSIKPVRQNRRMKMTSTVNGKPVTNVRDAKEGDPGYDASKDQVVVRNADGSESTVLRTDVKTS